MWASLNPYPGDMDELPGGAPDLRPAPGTCSHKSSQIKALRGSYNRLFICYRVSRPGRS
jgi:hypothetical protein